MTETSYPSVGNPMNSEFSYATGTSSQPSYKLFNAPSVALATLFGAPAAGALLMAINYRRLGQNGSAWLVMVLGLLVTGLAVAVGFVIPDSASVPLGLGLLLGTRLLAVKMQGELVAQHVSQGGKLGSKWAAFGVGIVFMVLICAAVFVPVYSKLAHEKVVIGSKDEVYYTGTATKEDAQQLGAALKKSGYFSDRGTSVFLDKDAAGATISLVMQEGYWDRPGMLFSAEEVVREVADSAGGFPVRVRIMDSSQNVKKQGMVGRVAVGKDEIFYFDNASQAEATALGNALKSEGYLTDRGSSVLLQKTDAVTAISFVVSEGFWNDAEHVAEFEKLTRTVAGAVGGLPVTVRLVNTDLESKKEWVVR